MSTPKYPGISLVANGNQLVAYYTEARLADAGVFYPITPSTEMGELFQLAFAEGKLNVFGRPKMAIETEGEHAAQAGAIAASVTGKRVVNFTSGQGIVYGLEQYYHAPGKLATMVLEVASRALTRHALNVHCGHDDIYAALEAGWIMLMARDAQQAADQALILRRVTELSLTPGINIQDGFLTSHLERSFRKHEAGLIREFLGAPDDTIDCPTAAQRELFGPTRRRVPEVIDLKNPLLIGPVQNQEHYMNGVIARRNSFYEPILGMLEDAYAEFERLTGRKYGLIREYNTDGSDTVFVSLGSAAENIEAAVDYLAETRGESVGSIHINTLRPFPEEAIVRALSGKKNVIVLERNDTPLAGDSPLARDVRVALGKAQQRHAAGVHNGVSLAPGAVPSVFTGAYGLGSRDFRPEGILGAYEYVQGKVARQDGVKAGDGESFFVVGIDHPYAVVSEETPSLLPDSAIAIRMHSIGGWGMITMGKNLAAIVGEFGDTLTEKADERDEDGELIPALHVSANPRYGSEKKGAPTAYFLVVANERIRVNCDLNHVNAVLCCDPKAFTHSNPLEGIGHGGAFVWESDESAEEAWTRVPQYLRQHIIDEEIRLFILPGFDIARRATERPDLQLRMQGNAFLGAFFKVSSFLDDHSIDEAEFRSVVRQQYIKKFGRFGDAVVESNMTVMTEGFGRVIPVAYGPVDAPDLSQMRGNPSMPIDTSASCGGGGCGVREDRAPVFQPGFFDREFRAGLGYNQPASALSSVGCVASATGATTSKYVARRETPVFLPENCTQCMDCMSACPDTALVSMAQPIDVILSTAIDGYVSNASDKARLHDAVPTMAGHVRALMLDGSKNKSPIPVSKLLVEQVESLDGVSDVTKAEVTTIVAMLPLAYEKTKAIFGTKEKRNPGTGGVFSIFVSDLCKGCSECVTECGHDALRMVPDGEDLNQKVTSTTAFMELLPETKHDYLGIFNADKPSESKPASLRNHLMVRKNYQAIVSGDGACAGCGEKTVLRAAATITEAHMRPIWHAKADRLRTKATQLKEHGRTRLAELAAADPAGAGRYRTAVLSVLFGLGGESAEDMDLRLSEAPAIGDQEIVGRIVAVLEQEAFNHKDLMALDGRLADGMSVMAMGASTGCNTVYGSTPPSNPHPYPWMNSLFQDGPTISWLMSESFIANHAQRSVVPERLCDALLDGGPGVLSEVDLFELTHFSDHLMTDQEIQELPKIWCVGGDGGLGDIGFQNLSKAVLQNRPNLSVLMLDTQVYSNTGGQNSDSSPMLGGFDMNQLGAATQGKFTEKKSVAEALTSGHGSPFVAQVSMADQPRLFASMLEGLVYRGTAFYQAFTSCQPEHGIGDDMATTQATRIRDSRGMPQFFFNPQKGETYQEVVDLAGNPAPRADWALIKGADGAKHTYTVAQWAATEARFRRHFKAVSAEETKELIPLENLLLCVTQNDVVNRRFLHTDHRAYVPNFGAFIEADNAEGTERTTLAVSRQMVLFCVERRKAWRMLQSRAGIDNKDYAAQRDLLAKLNSGKVSREDVLERGLDA